MLSLELLYQLGLERIRGNTGGISHSSVDGSKRSCGEGEWCASDWVWTEEIATASVQDSEGGSGGGEHQARPGTGEIRLDITKVG